MGKLNRLTPEVNELLDKIDGLYSREEIDIIFSDIYKKLKASGNRLMKSVSLPVNAKDGELFKIEEDSE